jgi:hypothetical protein
MIQRLFRVLSESNLFYGFDGLFVDFVKAIKSVSREGRSNYAKVPHHHLLRAAELMGALPNENRDGWFMSLQLRIHHRLLVDVEAGINQHRHRTCLGELAD